MPTLFPHRRVSQVRVHTKDGESYDGLLTGESLDWLTLAQASLVTDDGNGHPLTGELRFPRGNVKFVQADLR